MNEFRLLKNGSWTFDSFKLERYIFKGELLNFRWVRCLLKRGPFEKDTSSEPTINFEKIFVSFEGVTFPFSSWIFFFNAEDYPVSLSRPNFSSVGRIQKIRMIEMDHPST